MSRILHIMTLCFALFLSFPVHSDAQEYDVMVPIAKYIREGDADKLSAWFADNLEISVLSQVTESSRNQARQIMKSFFKSYKPRSFEVTHQVDKDRMKYALGMLIAGGERFCVTIFLSCSTDTFLIQQLRIERGE